MSVPVVVVGGGGMGRCLLDLLSLSDTKGATRWEVVGVVDDGSPDPALLAPYGVELLGTLDTLTELPADVGYLIGVGSSRTRRDIDAALRRSGRPSPVLVHPNVHLGREVHLGPGTVIASHVSIENHVRCGRHVHVNQNSTIGHDSVLGDHTTIGPVVAVSGGVQSGEAVFVGTGASIRQQVRIGDFATVGMGAAVVGDVAGHTTVLGVPARASGHAS